MSNIYDKVKQKFHLIDRWERITKTFSLPGFDSVPVYDVAIFFIKEIKRNSLPLRSKSIAFSFLFALFPALLFIFTLIPFLGIETLNEKNIEALLRSVLPSGDFYNFIFGTLNEVLTEKRSGLLTGSFLLSGYLTTNGVLAMMASFDKSYEQYKKRSTLHARWIATKISFFLVLMFLISVVLIVIGQDVFSYGFSLLDINSSFTRFVVTFMRYFVIVMLFFFSISLIYYYGPSTKRKYRFISPGATVATFMSLFATVGFSFYVTYFNRYNTIFGSIGTVMLLMLWFNLNAFVLLIGYELNASIYLNKKNKKRNMN